MKQLELFQVYTDEQVIEFNSKIERYKSQTKKQIERNNRELQVLLENGFVMGEDFVYSDEVVKEEVEFYVWDGDDRVYKTEELEVFKGYCKFKFLNYYSYNNELKECVTSFSFEKGKIQESIITGNWRYYKPSSFLTKLREKNEQSKHEYEYKNKKRLIKEYTIEKYQNLYPNCVVEFEGIYQRNYSNYETVKVTFPNGSSINFILGSEKDKERVYRFTDVVTKEMSGEELLNYFNNQNK